jgi:hypothetical protein
MDDGCSLAASFGRKKRHVRHNILGLGMQWRPGISPGPTFAEHVVLHILNNQRRLQRLDPKHLICSHLSP